MTAEQAHPYQGPHDVVVLPDADRDRMARLYEEVQGRLKEMSLIVARNLRMTLTAQTKVMLRPVSAEADAPGHVEVHCTETSPGHFECGCYDYDAGTCGPC